MPCPFSSEPSGGRGEVPVLMVVQVFEGCMPTAVGPAWRREIGTMTARLRSSWKLGNRGSIGSSRFQSPPSRASSSTLRSLASKSCTPGGGASHNAHSAAAIRTTNPTLLAIMR